jgi:hypothetical protein
VGSAFRRISAIRLKPDATVVENLLIPSAGSASSASIVVRLAFRTPKRLRGLPLARAGDCPAGRPKQLVGFQRITPDFRFGPLSSCAKTAEHASLALDASQSAKYRHAEEKEKRGFFPL